MFQHVKGNNDKSQSLISPSLNDKLNVITDNLATV